MGTNLCVLLPESSRSGQSRFIGLGSNGGGVEQVSCTLLGLFLSGERMRVLVFLLGNGRTEFVRYPVEGIVERYAKRWIFSVSDLRRTGIHVPPTRNPLHVRWRCDRLSLEKSSRACRRAQISCKSMLAPETMCPSCLITVTNTTAQSLHRTRMKRKERVLADTCVCVCVYLLYSVQLGGQRSPLSTTSYREFWLS